MNFATPQLNLMLAWLWVILGCGGGFGLGTGFHREEWLGGYASFKRRLYRLGHISFFGLAILNLMFYLTVQSCDPASVGIAIAGWAFITGAVLLPACCLIMAHQPRLRVLFLVPVLSLLMGALLTLWEAIHL